MTRPSRGRRDDDEVAISATVESDGEVMIGAAGVVAWLRDNAVHYDSGRRGGSRCAQRAARQALTEMADALQENYISACADEVLDRWEPWP